MSSQVYEEALYLVLKGDKIRGLPGLEVKYLQNK